MFGQFSGQQQTHGGLDLSRCDGGALVVVSETRRFTGDALEDVVDERVHDPHRLRRDPGVRMNLLHHFVDVDSVALLPCLSALLSSFNGGLSNGLLGALLRRGLCWFRHDDDDTDGSMTIMSLDRRIYRLAYANFQGDKESSDCVFL